MCYHGDMEIADVQHLAGLARIALTNAEAAELATEFDAILSYVAQVTKVSADTVGSAPTVGVHANVLREDTETHEPGVYTETLLNAAPKRNARYIEVKKILEEK